MYIKTCPLSSTPNKKWKLNGGDSVWKFAFNWCCGTNYSPCKLMIRMSKKYIPEIPTLLIWSGVSRFDVYKASRSPEFYQILPIYYKILKTREKSLIFRIFGNLSLWNTHIILTFFAKSIMVYVITVQAHTHCKVSILTWLSCKIMVEWE